MKNKQKSLKDKLTSRRFAFSAGLTALIILLIVFFDLVFGVQAESKYKPYYNGDAASYGGRIIISSTNTGNLEIFKLEGDKIVRTAVMASDNVKGPTFLSSILREENGNLYAYAVDGRYLVKYDVSNPEKPQLVRKEQDNSWDWFVRIRPAGDLIATIGAKQVKLWNKDMQIVNAFDNSDKDYNINFSSDGDYMFKVLVDQDGDVENDFLQITNTKTRKVVSENPIVLTKDNIRQVYFDSNKKEAYIAGDRVLKRINVLDGSVKNFKHTSNDGYFVDGIAGRNYVYFSDGVGIVKVDNNLTPVDWVYSGKLEVPMSWSMGIKALTLKGLDRVVAFNHSSIAVLDENLDPIAFYKATEQEEIIPQPAEALSLSVDKNRAPRNSQVSLRATGFRPNEQVEVYFGGPRFYRTGVRKEGLEMNKVVATADSKGRFTKILEVPNEVPEFFKQAEYELREFPIKVDIVAEGLESKSRYQLGFTIE